MTDPGKLSRRQLLLSSSSAALGAAVVAGNAEAATQAEPVSAVGTGTSVAATHGGGRRQVRTLNGWTLPWTMKGGVKEFHLVAEEVEHEFAPGSRATCWGYNGTTPGPTIEAVEGDRVRILVTNRLKEHTSVHWHGVVLPSGMDGVAGLSQPPIGPGETYAYEFTLQQHGTLMYHPHADDMLQVSMGMMGLFIIHPRGGDAVPVDRDYAFLLHNWALHPGRTRPDPSVMQSFDLWTFNGKVFPAIDPLVARTGERVRIRMGNLSMWNHPIHLHGHQYVVTGSDAGRWPQAQWRRETTEIVGVGQTRDVEFIARPGDWAFHCHMLHHTMNAMGHEIPNNLGANLDASDEAIARVLPGYSSMGTTGMSEHAEHTAMGHMQGPANTLPMMMGTGPYGNLEMGGMVTVVKVRDRLSRDAHDVPGWYEAPAGTVANLVSEDPDFGAPVRRKPYGKSNGE